MAAEDPSAFAGPGMPPARPISAATLQSVTPTTPGATAAELQGTYQEYAKTLRTWFVAYGIGAPVLFLSNASLADKLLKSGMAKCIATLFLAGVGLQILIAMLNKSTMWACYYAELFPSVKHTLRFRLADWFSQQYLIDLGFDLATLTLFGFATVKAFQTLVAAT